MIYVFYQHIFDFKMFAGYVAAHVDIYVYIYVYIHVFEIHRCVDLYFDVVNCLRDVAVQYFCDIEFVNASAIKQCSDLGQSHTINIVRCNIYACSFSRLMFHAHNEMLKFQKHIMELCVGLRSWFCLHVFYGY